MSMQLQGCIAGRQEEVHWAVPYEYYYNLQDFSGPLDEMPPHRIPVSARRVLVYSTQFFTAKILYEPAAVASHLLAFPSRANMPLFGDRTTHQQTH